MPPRAHTELVELRVVGDLVLTKFESAEENEPILAVEKRMTACGLGAMPVRGGDGPVTGVVTKRQLIGLRQTGANLESRSAGEIATPVEPVDPGDSLESALEALRMQEVGRLPVVHNGEELGLITRGDILAYRGLRRLLGREPDDLITKVSEDDEMSGESFWSYISFGVSALECVKSAQAVAGKESFESILDFACGHGRILRVLKAAFPDAKLAACDINEDGVRFCEAELGATPFVSRENPDEIELAGKFDLIWCGSLLTHVDRDRWHPFLRLFESVLAPSGLLVFTVLGPTASERLRAGALYGSPQEADRVNRILHGFEESGFGYSDYEGQAGYGLSLSTREWVRAAHRE